MGQGGVTAEQSLLQQLHQVQEELERHYLKCVELDAELQLARSDREDAAREAADLADARRHALLRDHGFRVSLSREN